ncbi:hypothetical protein BD289DRAFT_485239 [Coniella lustricola]|uniref:DUF7730 domain-containing protein n=1 Tax=Coniella lustricola TaxID=2025994 RepID=A0A2T2ZZB0_9PEZI|nr:hypothetical protein BD289DRAFT_485239 [Coniella lustricola]
MSEVGRVGRAACPFVDVLPAEIRVQIYEYLLFEHGNFFSLDDEEGVSVPTLFPKLRAPLKRNRHHRQQQQQQRQLSQGDPDGGEKQQRRERTCKGNILPLLLTNKLIYDESANLLYSTSFFRLRGINSTLRFINAVEPAHLALVRSLKLVWDDQGWTSAPEYDTLTLRSAWPSLCDALAHDLPGLRNLYVALGISSQVAHVEAQYLNELARVRHVDNFKVCVPVGFLTAFYKSQQQPGHANRTNHELDSDARQVADDAFPFQLCRHTAGDICSVRREVIEAEWMGSSRPATPRLKIIPNAPPLPLAASTWEPVMKALLGDDVGA